MLRQVLQMVEAADGPITLTDLSRRLNVAPEALEGMLEHWARKGRLDVDSNTAACAGGGMAGCACSGGSCAASGCPFVARLPRSYVVARRGGEPPTAV